MKLYRNILIAMLMTLISQASMSQSGKEHFGKPTVIVAQPQTVTRSVPGRVKIVKPKLFVSTPFHRADDLDDALEDDIITSYRRRDLNKIEHEDGISEHVRWKLFLARQLALLKHKQVWG